VSAKFIWADLSTFDINAAREFYAQCFNWQYLKLDESYFSCSASGFHTAGLYTMAQQFQRIGMPSFWMSYIQVTDLEKTVSAAEKQGARIELPPGEGPDGGMIALIRDPAGAGFTCYQGNNTGEGNYQNRPGCVAWHELHVSDVKPVASFYSNVFDWHISETDKDGRYDLFTSDQKSTPHASIQVISNDLKGDKEYWAVYFLVSSLVESAECIENNGGRVSVVQSSGRQQSLLAYDSQGAAFYLVEQSAGSPS